MISDHYDIVIIGGGPVGMALALDLQDTGISSLLLEARGLPETVQDPRPLALSYGSHLILHRLNVWKRLPQKTPINTIHISNRGSFGQTLINTEDADVPALGFVVNYHELFSTMHKLMIEKEINYIAGATVTQLDTTDKSGLVSFDYQGRTKHVSAQLLVLADGGQLAQQLPGITYQTHDYQQWAVVANIHAETKQSGMAYERFTSTGPIALLPNLDDFALVWTTTQAIAKEIVSLPENIFLHRLHQNFGDRLGQFIHTGKRSAFPLQLKYAAKTTSQRSVLIGNAAQTLHPVAGQGFNLGLRDAHELAREILRTHQSSQNIGTTAMLARYHQHRRIDNTGGRMFTDSLVKFFTNDSELVKHASGLGLSVLNTIPPLKKFVARRMIFGARG